MSIAGQSGICGRNIRNNNTCAAGQQTFVLSSAHCLLKQAATDLKRYKSKFSSLSSKSFYLYLLF